MAERKRSTYAGAERQLNKNRATISSRATANRAVGTEYAPAVAPKRRISEDERQRREYEKRRRIARQKAELEKARLKAERKVERQKILQICAACAVIIAISYFFLSLRADINNEKDKVLDLQYQLQTQLDENAGYRAGLDSMTDLDEIYNIATKELHMVYSDAGKTLYYTKNNNDYVIQYKDVPEAN